MFTNDLIRVYRTPLGKLPGVPGAHADSVVACWRATGRRTRLLRESPDDDGSFELDGVRAPAPFGSPIIAFRDTLITRSGATDAIASVNVATGRVLHTTARDRRAYVLAEVPLGITAFLVTPSGSLAWIGQGECPGSTDPSGNAITGVYAIDATGRERVLVCGTPGGDLGPGSGPAEFAGLRYEQDNAQLSWLSRSGLGTATLR